MCPHFIHFLFYFRLNTDNHHCILRPVSYRIVSYTLDTFNAVTNNTFSFDEAVLLVRLLLRGRGGSTWVVSGGRGTLSPRHISSGPVGFIQLYNCSLIDKIVQGFEE